ncbi:hypothetical protein SB782_35670, partial [Brevibacillus sp. SIMBA_076]
IERMPGGSGHDLAVATFQSDQSFSALATRLMDRGLVTRSAGRGRRLEYALTDSGRAALVVAHRLSTVRALDRLLVLDKGKVLEEGS